MRISAFSCIKKRPNCALTPRGLQIDCRTSRGPCRNIVGLFLKLLGLVLGASGGAIGLPEGPTDYASRAIAIPIPPPTKPLPRAAFGGRAPLRMFPTRSSLTSSGFTRDRSSAALPSSTAETSAKAPQNLPNGLITLPARWIFLFVDGYTMKDQSESSREFLDRLEKAFRDLMVRRDDLEYFRHRHFRPTPKPPKQNPNAK
jgi:hypothetical protein